MNRSASISLLGVSVAVMACGDDTSPPLGGPGGTGGGTAGMGGGTAGMGGAGATGGGGAGATGGMGGSAGHLEYAVCDDPPIDYPAAPYGHELGDTFAPLDLQGWINPDGSDLANTAAFVPFTWQDLRQAGSAHVMLHLAATW
jgi:hypothetical protein